MAKTLTLWNGRGIALSHKLNGAYVYLAAYSMADARRLCEEAGFWDPGATELKKYWNKGC